MKDEKEQEMSSIASLNKDVNYLKVPESLEAAFNMFNEANDFYELKHYEEAVERYSLALERIVEEYGETDTRNAAIFYAYGRALFHLAVKRSGVFGGAVPFLEETNVESGTSSMMDSTRFCFSGDGNSDDESAEVTKEDDFGIAWETLDYARILYEKMLNIKEDAHGEMSENYVVDSIQENERIAIQKKLADTYDLLGEISLENENFQQASVDFQSSLDLKSQIYPFESSLVSEAHYKLALALEFSKGNGLREKAIEHLQLVIKSLEKRMEIVQKDEKDDEKQAKDISEIQEMLSELREKIKELQRPLEKMTTKTVDFQSIMGNSHENIRNTLSEMISNANDVNFLVKKKKKILSNGVSKLDDENKHINEPHNKKIKVEDVNC